MYNSARTHVRIMVSPVIGDRFYGRHRDDKNDVYSRRVGSQALRGLPWPGDAEGSDAGHPRHEQSALLRHRVHARQVLREPLRRRGGPRGTPTGAARGRRVHPAWRRDGGDQVGDPRAPTAPDHRSGQGRTRRGIGQRRLLGRFDHRQHPRCADCHRHCDEVRSAADGRRLVQHSG